MNQLLITLTISLLLVVLSLRVQGQQGNLRKGGRRPFRKQIDEREQANSFTVAFPMGLLSDSAGTPTEKNWRAPAVRSQELYDLSESGKPYAYLSKAQDQEDIWLYENWFYGLRDGVIMESGALDGKLFSTSYMFEKFANWTALHVEADPENYSHLKRNRPRAINVNGALCNEPRLLHYSSEGVIPVRGFIEFMSPSFIKQWHGKIYNNKTRIEDLPTVQCLPVRMLLKELNVKHVDLWILDTEGAEESVLKGTDFSAVHFNAVAMECDEHDISKNERKTSILESNGFKCTLVERNCMCKHKDFSASSSKSLSTLKKWDGQKWAKTYNPSTA